MPNATALLSLAKLSYVDAPRPKETCVDAGAILLKTRLLMAPEDIETFEWSPVRMCPSAIFLLLIGPLPVLPTAIMTGSTLFPPIDDAGALLPSVAWFLLQVADDSARSVGVERGRAR